jgi:competence protein ComEA
MFGRLSKKIGLTKTELKIISFLIAVFVIGLVYQMISQNQRETIYRNFDYSKEDAEFLNSGNDLILNNNEKSENKKVDYKQEVLDFNTRSFDKVNKKSVPKENSININSAKIEELINLPGIGQKTAKNIVEYRKRIKQFRNINELLNVKGIGKTKLNNIKNYIFIE